MNRYSFLLSVVGIILISSCSSTRRSAPSHTANTADVRSRVVIKKSVPAVQIATSSVSAGEVVKFAETLIGVPYKYGSVKKENGFDCSGFITYVFNHFNIIVPRISSDFTNAGQEVLLRNSRRGDLILFTGKDEKSGVVGHMGIITKNENGVVEFIHASTSRGVMISGLNSYFLPRFVKANRIFSIF